MASSYPMVGYSCFIFNGERAKHRPERGPGTLLGENYYFLGRSLDVFMIRLGNTFSTISASVSTPLEVLVSI
ncbi:hypothetical protein QE422_003736 [Chryseobacterium sp. SORGH_AS 447]|nr:hypothetical protein [Chryseobacterium sp. SORGH_AS_0447]MDQ1163368.1 hypothetical protein [Chryseobacterium sp. SORGH_AS_0447]